MPRRPKRTVTGLVTVAPSSGETMDSSTSFGAGLRGRSAAIAATIMQHAGSTMNRAKVFVFMAGDYAPTCRQAVTLLGSRCGGTAHRNCRVLRPRAEGRMRQHRPGHAAAAAQAPDAAGGRAHCARGERTGARARRGKPGPVRALPPQALDLPARVAAAAEGRRPAAQPVGGRVEPRPRRMVRIARRAVRRHVVEPWPGVFDNPMLTMRERTNYRTREDMLKLGRRLEPNAPTAVVEHGANHGLVSHFVKQELVDAPHGLAAPADVPLCQPRPARPAPGGR